jgi:hypothetical protein
MGVTYRKCYTLADFFNLDDRTVTSEVAGSSPVGSAFIINELREVSLEIPRLFPVHVSVDVSLTGC